MGYILSFGASELPNTVSQEDGTKFAENLFEGSFKDLPRLLRVFRNGEIETRNFAEPLDWYKEDHTFGEKNSRYIEHAAAFGAEAAKAALANSEYLAEPLNYPEIDAIFFISTTGLSTPSIDAKIMNALPFKETTKRIPLWGLGCAGGAAGLARAMDYCRAYPEANVLVLAVELCSLTFQKGDVTKSNLVGTSLFADGAACMVVAGEKSEALKKSALRYLPKIEASRSVLMKNSEEVMGWDVDDDGLHVIFSRDIPSIIKEWLGPNVRKFLKEERVDESEIEMFLAHPGGKKVLDAYMDTLQLNENSILHSREVLKSHGNMSSVTVLYVIARAMTASYSSKPAKSLSGALGPGFSAELLLLGWEAAR